MRKHDYRSVKVAEHIRARACRMAADVVCAEGGCDDSGRLWSLCVFFEAYISGGSKATVKDFGPKKAPKVKAATVVQLITRD